jgi:hypothetical protein
MDKKKVIEAILEKCTYTLFQNIRRGATLTPKEFENEVEAGLKMACEGTEFDGQTQADFGQKFPDITFEKGVYGVEVKFSKDKNLQTIGNSVLEGTRREGIDEIYILFGSFVKDRDPKFLWRKYEECCVDIAVTHYPRYKINMNAKKGESIFDKIGVPYKNLQKMEQVEVLDTFRKYYRRNNASLWWLGRVDAEEDYVPAAFNFLNELPDAEQSRLLHEAFIYFPELVGDNRRKKYKGFVEWLLRKNIVCHNARDFFTSGGRESRKIGKLCFDSLSQVVARLCDSLDAIKKAMPGIDSNNLKLYWDLEKRPKSQQEILKEWADRLIKNLSDKEHNERYLKIKLKNAFGRGIFASKK